MAENSGLQTPPPQVWQRIFQDDPDGAAILEYLFTRYVYQSSFVPGSPDQTAYNAGKCDLALEIAFMSGEGMRRDQA